MKKSYLNIIYKNRQLSLSLKKRMIYLIVSFNFAFKFHYPFDIDCSANFDGYITLPDILTLGAMKVFTLGRRAKWKDYVDLYFIFQKHSFTELIDKTNSIFKSEFNEKLFRTQLSYFEDIDHSEEIEYMQGFEQNKDIIKQYLSNLSVTR